MRLDAMFVPLLVLLSFVLYLISIFKNLFVEAGPAASPITPRAPRTGGGGIQIKTDGRKHPSPWFPPARPAGSERVLPPYGSVDFTATRVRLVLCTRTHVPLSHRFFGQNSPAESVR